MVKAVATPQFDLEAMHAHAGDAAQLLTALANERRLQVLCLLAAGERSVGEMQGLLDLGQSALSQHLAVLREEGVVATRREGQTIWYRIADPAAMKVVATLAEIFCPPDMKKADDNSTDQTEAQGRR